MKKMLKAGLAVFTMAMLASSASAFSPAWDTPPDVLIGGCEPGGLVFTDAFDVFSILSDQDNTSPQLSVYFAEGPWDTLAARSAQVTDGNATSELTINAQSEIDYSGPGDVLLADQSLLTGGELSGVNNNLLFATATDLIDRAVVLIASDGFTSPAVSKVFRVRSDNAACDEASVPSFVVAVNVDSWDTQAECNADWAFGTFVIAGTAATSGATGDALIINNPLVGQNLSFWQLSASAPKIPATGIIRTRWTVRSSVAENQWPAVQMRVFEFDNHNTVDLLVSASGYVPPANTSRTYESFYGAPADLTNDLAVAFFNVDTNDAQGGNFTLEQVVVDSIVGLDALFTPVQVIDSGESITFSNAVNIDFGASITFAQSAGSVTFTGATITGTNFAFEIAQVNNAVASASANTLYRMINTMTSTTAVNSQFGWGFRLFAGNNAISSVNRVAGIGTSSAVLATTTPKDYTTYLTSNGITGQPLFIALDILHNDVNRGGNVTWDRSVIQSVDLSLVP
jgi:hypothetical protein